MSQVKRHIYTLLKLLTLLNLASTATARMPLIAYSLSENVTSIQNHTASLTYSTSSLQDTTLHTQLSSIAQASISASSSSLAPLSEPSIATISQAPTSTSPPPSTSTSSAPPCAATCPGTGKICGSRLGDSCPPNTLYSCMNNWDPPLVGKEKDCAVLDEKGKGCVCKQGKQGFWANLTGQFKDGCADA